MSINEILELPVKEMRKRLDACVISDPASTAISCIHALSELNGQGPVERRYQLGVIIRRASERIQGEH